MKYYMNEILILASSDPKFIERAFVLENLRKAGQRVGRGVDAGTAAGRQLGGIEMRRAVGAKEEGRIARGRRRDKSEAMCLALAHRKAVVMRSDPAC